MQKMPSVPKREHKNVHIRKVQSSIFDHLIGLSNSLKHFLRKELTFVGCSKRIPRLTNVLEIDYVMASKANYCLFK